MKLNKILLATDLSEESESPYAAVSELARSSGASIELLHVIEDLPMAPAGAPFAPPVHTGDLPAQLASVSDVVAEHARRLGDGLEISTQVLAANTSEQKCVLIEHECSHLFLDEQPRFILEDGLAGLEDFEPEDGLCLFMKEDQGGIVT